MQITIKKFDQLSIKELYEILKLRNEIFIVEQNCPYLDIDGKDQASVHIFMYEKELKAYLRIIPGAVPAIGRVVVSENYRKHGLARQLMDEAISYINKNYQPQKIKLQAQTYLLLFYESFGFKAVTEEYLEDGIPHRDMEKSMV